MTAMFCHLFAARLTDLQWGNRFPQAFVIPMLLSEPNTLVDYWCI